MADVSEEVPIKDAATAISQGKRHLLVRDYHLAVAVLARACELLAQEHGETGDEMGELYLLYGRALLGLAREEAGVLGGGVPGSEEVSQDEQGEDEEEENEEGTITEGNHTESSSCTSNGKEDDKQETKDEEKEAEELKDSKGTKVEGSEGLEKDDKIEESDKTVDSKIEEQNKQREEIPGCSRDFDMHNGEASGSGMNRKKEDGDEEAEEEDVEKENDEDEINNLQIAWEVLELAKLVLVKRGPPGWKFLAEAYRLLGEVAMESSNHESALIDFKACLNLLEKMTPRDHRAIAEIHYQLGLAHAMANNFDISIEQFNQASALLEAKIVHLKTLQDDPPQSDDPFYTVEGEIKELQELLPEIQEKIADINDLKKEANLLKEIKEEKLNGCSSDGEANEASGSGSSNSKLKPASDISHLVRKKRKAEDEEETASLCKKPAPEKDVA
ncbi:PREDICTED: protein HGV2 [Cyphomyrmex costatus]|uniref:Nuclear autoantigenic sperm protein n=1 Tax=Cyphomyrmex costatus TaxID=456900 RepID=A0A195CRR4_9HYME|nr:PREDICTED: protein HGV2 [Cyphomyrmex costatus]KYN03396.1 Nuclear autoantigenic sperm protein [Cyphomyrmex costatus]